MIHGFPTDEHVQNVCKPGTEETCRYLVMGPSWECAKGTFLGRQLEERGDTMNAQGDNCEGIIAELCDGRLVGKAVHHEETMPPFAIDGKVTKLEVSNGMLKLSADWSDGEQRTLSIALGFLNVSEQNGSTVIGAAFPGGNTWIFSPVAAS